MEIQEAIDIRYEEIEGLQQKLTEDHYMNPEQEDELEELITKAIKFGELCAQRDAKAQVIPEGFEQAYSKIFSPIVKRPYPRLENGNYKYIEIDQGWKLWQAATAQAVPDGFVLVPKAGAQYFSHDFNGDGFKYHDTLDEAKKEAEVNLDWYRDQVADGRHVNDMGEFNELSYGLVIGSAEYSIDHVVTQDDIDKGEYSYEVGTEILSLYLSEAKEQSHEQNRKTNC